MLLLPLYCPIPVLTGALLSVCLCCDLTAVALPMLCSLRRSRGGAAASAPPVVRFGVFVAAALADALIPWRMAMRMAV